MRQFKITSRLCLTILFTISAYSFGQNFSGVYYHEEQGNIINLKINQDESSNITGSLSSAQGASYTLEGFSSEGAAVGVCRDNQGSVYFEAYFEGNQLIFTLMEMDEYNMPDYDNATQIIFAKGKAKSTSPATGTDKPRQFAGESTKMSGNEISDGSWGFKFNAPEGWTFQKNANGVILGHFTIAGIILVFPHQENNFQSFQNSMAQGLSEEGNNLQLSGSLAKIGDNILAGDYEGIYEGQIVKSRGFGTLSPNGGGAHILCLSTPEKFSIELANAGKAIAENMKFVKAEVSDVMKHFVGSWQFQNAYRTDVITFYPNGYYSNQYEAAYGGRTSDSYGNQTGAWGVGNQSNYAGRWSISGTKEQGQITTVDNNGRTIIYNYKVMFENGNYLWNEYWFNGELYARK
ncbi:MAG: hypothetical protein KJ799_10530 [Bacteroidetes bacterium]|nr:hypothetical protein [Bacteroidota bacterium]MBU1679852.1 hypothetical protein [Bacteroidota bacterium]MBU2507143.1 hypothetical protein [Bacteroidota bacterium]